MPPATNSKIDELRAKLKADPKSRLFYQLAEELRKSGQAAESEQVLRSGLSAYPTYLAAWVSLGRTLRELKKDAEAIEPLNTALQLDPVNVVAARLLGDAYYALGERVEAVKKYKLVHALLPGDEELNARIAELEREITPMQVSEADPDAESQTEVSGTPGERSNDPDAIASSVQSTDADAADVFELSASTAAPAAGPGEAEAEPSDSDLPSEPVTMSPFEESPFDRTMPPFDEAGRAFVEEQDRAEATADDEPMTAAHDESPFENPVESFTANAVTIEGPAGFQIDAAPLAAEVPSAVDDDAPVVDDAPVFDTPAAAPPATPEDATSTLTMADLYVKQGLVEEARHIYQTILARDPGNSDVRARLEAIVPDANPKIVRLERWLSRMRRDVSRSVRSDG